MSSQLLNDLILFTIDRSGDEGDHYDLNTDIEKHIGITGDDAAEYILAFSKRYNVDISEFDFDQHFDPEGAGWLFPESINHHKIPVTIGMLLQVIERKKW
ncbi:MAG: DUF1493 family protein [Chitinophagaceae bacterium]|nr:DUF1493 family protein [Chitinophagaceae bacterium]